MSFGNLGPAEVALVCTVALLMFGARDLALLNDRDPVRRAMARRGYVLSVLGGLGFGSAVSALAVPTRIFTPLLVAVCIASAFVVRFWSPTTVVRGMRWDLGMASASLLSCGITLDVLAFWIS